jgi:hypothetical protein
MMRQDEYDNYEHVNIEISKDLFQDIMKKLSSVSSSEWETDELRLSYGIDTKFYDMFKYKDKNFSFYLTSWFDGLKWYGFIVCYKKYWINTSVHDYDPVEVIKLYKKIYNEKYTKPYESKKAALKDKIEMWARA